MCVVWNTANNGGVIPSGWTLCDGKNINNIAVPNLIDRFVMGAGGTYNNGQVGGSTPGSQTTEPGGSHSHSTSSHALTLAELPTALSSNVQVNQAASTDADSHHDTTSLARGSETPNAETTLPMSITGLGNSAHDHGDTAIVSAHTHDLGAGTLPPFQALTWICFVGIAA
jgi:hypothetical protein